MKPLPVSPGELQVQILSVRYSLIAEFTGFTLFHPPWRSVDLDLNEFQAVSSYTLIPPVSRWWYW